MDLKIIIKTETSVLESHSPEYLYTYIYAHL